MYFLIFILAIIIIPVIVVQANKSSQKRKDHLALHIQIIKHHSHKNNHKLIFNL